MNLAVDIGGTFFRYKLNEKINILKTKEIDILTTLQNIIDENNIKNVAISFAGGVYNNRVIFSPNIKKIDFNKLKVKNLFVENDVNLAALANSKYYKKDNLLAIYIGTGIGAGFIYKDKIFKTGGVELELGHIPYKKSKFICGCGKDNCLELFASGRALELRNIKELKNSNYFDEFTEAFYKGISTAITLFNPKMVVLGGGVIEHNLYLVDLLKENIKNFALKYSLSNLKIVASPIIDAPLKGAEIVLKEGYENII